MNEKDFKKKIEAKLQAFYTQGLKDGSKAICSVVINKLKGCDSSSSKEKFLEAYSDIINFCEISLGSKKNT